MARGVHPGRGFRCLGRGRSRDSDGRDGPQPGHAGPAGGAGTHEIARGSLENALKRRRFAGWGWMLEFCLKFGLIWESLFYLYAIWSSFG